MSDVVDQSVTGSLRSDLGSSKVESLSCKAKKVLANVLDPHVRGKLCRTSEDTRPFISVSLVSSEHVSDFTSSNSDISSRNISVASNVSGQLLHESLNSEGSECRITVSSFPLRRNQPFFLLLWSQDLESQLT